MARRMVSPVLVGRAAAVGQLQAALTAARTGEPRHIVIGGEAGIGKTRLMTHMRALAEGDGARVLTGSCVRVGDAGLPFAPFTEIVRTLVAQEGAAQISAIAGRAALDLARLVPALSPEETPPAQEMWAQTRLYEAIFELFRRLAARAPLVVQLEDLHWADATTLAATSFLMRSIHVDAITIAATFRSDEVTRRHPLRPWLAEIARDDHVERIDLEPLEAADLALLVHGILDEDLKPSELRDIYQRSDGNPFFVEELLCCRLDVTNSLPASLRDVLLARVDLLDESARHLISVAAVGGRDVEHELLMAVVGDSQADERGAADLGSLVEAGLLVPSQGFDGDDAYSFRHALLQEAVYDGLLPTERRRLHQLWGEASIVHDAAHASGANQLVRLAYHWREARDERALAASIAAGDAAIETFSFELASREYEQALLLWQERPAVPVGLDHIELLRRSSRAAYLASDFRHAVAAAREAIEELGDDDPARRTDLQILLGRTLWVGGHWDDSIAAYEEALRVAPVDPPIMRARALSGLGQVYMLQARLRDARPLLEEAIERARALGDLQLEGHGRNSLAVVLAALGETAEGNDLIGQALEIATRLGIPDDIGRAYVNRADIEYLSGNPLTALETAIEGMAVAADYGISNSYGVYIGIGAVAFAFECGRWQDASRILAQVDRAGAAEENVLFYRAAYVMEFMACRGDPDVAALWQRARQFIGDRQVSDSDAVIFQAGIEHWAFIGEFDQALAIAREGIDMIDWVDTGYRGSGMARVAAWPLAEVGRRARTDGDRQRHDEVERQFDRLLELARAWPAQGVRLDERVARMIELDTAQVEAERARMRRTATAQTWRVLADGWAELGRPFRSAMARWREAEMADESGDRDAAAAALREAHRIAAELDAQPLTAHLQLLSRKLRVRLGAAGRTAAAPDAAFGLTRREREVLALVVARRTNKQIAASLFISESTAGVHVSNIIAKLGVATRTEAAELALSSGALEA